MAAIWKGALSFGLIHIPVHLHSAVRSKEGLSFRMLHKKDNTPIKYQRVCPKDKQEVPWSDIVKGYEISKGQFVVLEKEDFEKAAVATSRRVDVLDFVKADEVDARFFETPYYLVPQAGGEKPYALFREALARTGTLGIGKLTLRQKQHLVAVQASGDALVLHLMRFAGELVDVEDFNLPKADKEAVRPQELAMAEQLVANLSESFDPSKYADEYTRNLKDIIKAKSKGRTVEVEEVEEEADTGVIDLMARLQESLDRADQLKRSGAVRDPRPKETAARAKKGTSKSAGKSTKRAATKRTRRTRAA
jgi:DNA end-binding protein Ku